MHIKALYWRLERVRTRHKHLQDKSEALLMIFDLIDYQQAQADDEDE
jgi:hypothetical protein